MHPEESPPQYPNWGHLCCLTNFLTTHHIMDPLGVLSVAAGIVAFVDFGGKIVSCYLELRRLGDEDELPIFLRQLRYDVEQVLRVVNTTLAKAEGMKAKYPSQNKSLKSLASHCTTAHERMEAALKELLSMVDGATQMSYKVLVTTWIVSKEAEFKFT